MCLTNVTYSCHHKEKHTLKCRKLWSARTARCCYLAFLPVFGWPTEEPCNGVLAEKAIISSQPCPECTEAEQFGPQTKGIVPGKYRHKLTPEALNASRKRMVEQKDKVKEEVVKERWYSRVENFQETLRKREHEKRLEREAAPCTNANTSKPLPDMPLFVHIPLSNRWGDPSYHYPRHVAEAYGAPSLTHSPSKEYTPSNQYEQQQQKRQQRTLYSPKQPVENIDAVSRDQDPTSTDSEPNPSDHQRHGTEHDATPVDNNSYAQHTARPADNVDRQLYAPSQYAGLYPNDYHSFEGERASRGQGPHSTETQHHQTQNSLYHQTRHTEPKGLTNSEPNAVPAPLIAERRGHKKPPPALTGERSRPRGPHRRCTEPTPPAKTPKSGSLKGFFFQGLGSSSRRSKGTCHGSGHSHNAPSDVHSDNSSFVCRESRDVEKGRK
ncbi:hypothetical protein CTA2_4365 [Colletotrichum tanaceti]|uniref:Uncharacterized protein n=1 Tax=Colletotrichum tanaceti TaxID=1306861 RepID=A0A4U6X914_9PEZI|nr:hypothetical protein CTA2_4365 [Colletotrichum tanaceti]TKW52070.1 hypothetical protein CTA1_12242 [Colletotrichum tanaceti]